MSILTGLLSHGEPEGISRGELQILVNMAQQHGAIEDDESKVLTNTLEFDALVVRDVMTPRIVMTTLPSTATIGDFLKDDTMHVFSRLPVHQSNQDDVIGYVHQRDLLLAAAKDDARDTPVTKFIRPIPSFPEQTTLGEALRKFLDHGEHLAVAQDEFGGTSGLVTLEDVIETMLGSEIVDEVDQVADLRHFASELLQKRLAKRDAQIAALRQRESDSSTSDA
jgi:CBS domain containing-hemolysin-like protein